MKRYPWIYIHDSASHHARILLTEWHMRIDLYVSTTAWLEKNWFRILAAVSELSMHAQSAPFFIFRQPVYWHPLCQLLSYLPRRCSTSWLSLILVPAVSCTGMYSFQRRRIALQTCQWTTFPVQQRSLSSGRLRTLRVYRFCPCPREASLCWWLRLFGSSYFTVTSFRSCKLSSTSQVRTCYLIKVSILRQC